MSAKAKKEAKRLEKLKAEAEEKKAMKRAELQREMTIQAIKRNELDKNWRKMMIKIKEPVFRQDIEVMWHTFERAYDKKDHMIAHIMRLMDIADDQYQRAIANFCNTIDTIIEKFFLDMDKLSQENNRKTAELMNGTDDEDALNRINHEAAEKQLNLLIYHADKTTDDRAWTTRGENLVKADEDMDKYLNIREDLRSFLEYNYNATWNNYKDVLKGYIMGTAENQKQVRKLRRKENFMSDIIAYQAKKIAINDNVLKRLRSDLNVYESGTKQAGYRDRRNKHRDACNRLKKNLHRGEETDVKQLALLVNHSDDAVKSLEAAHKKVEKILRMAALCRKYETRIEKVLPYGLKVPYSPTQAELTVRKKYSNDSLVVNAISTTSGLNRLWQRVANAELTKRALLREKMMLEHENTVIMLKIQEGGENTLIYDKLQCICSDNNMIKSPPCAIDGTLEISKIKFLDKQ